MPEVCRELRGNLIEIYWILLVPYVVFLICLEFFKIPETNISAGRILKRVIVSMLLLYSFEQCMNVLAMISDGVTDKIGGIIQLKDLLKRLEENYKSTEVSWLHVREAVLYIISLLSYIVAYLGVFVADVLIHFVWSILYVVSPLMILMYVSEKTAFVTSNLYRGLINVISWKVLWQILAVLLLKLATTPEIAASTDNFIMAVLLNLCIGLSMLFIPIATKSLIMTGFESGAAMLAAAPAAAAFGAVKLYTMKFGKKGLNVGKTLAKEPFVGFRETKAFTSRNYDRIKTGVEKGKEIATKSQEVARKVRSFGVSDARKTQDPFDPSGPFGKGKDRDRILRGKE